MRGAATKAMSDIVEERQQRRCPPAAAPLRAAARRPAGFVARSSHTAPAIARRSRLASGPGGQQQNVNLFLREPLTRLKAVKNSIRANSWNSRQFLLATKFHEFHENDHRDSDVIPCLRRA